MGRYKMMVRELRERKEKLRNDILGTVFHLVEDFKKDTGMSPRDVRIDMVCISRVGKGETEYVVSGVDVEKICV
jgi:hypothetical protein